MKKFILASALGMAVLAGSAFAKDEIVKIDNKVVKVSKFSENWFTKKINYSELKNGVYIAAGSMSNSNSRFKNEEFVIKNIFESNNIKVVDNINDADIVIKFDIMGAIDNSSIEKQATYSVLPNAERVEANANLVLGLGKTLGNGGLIGSVVGLVASSFADSDVHLAVFSNKKQTSKKPISASFSDNTELQGADFAYSLEKSKEANDATVLKVAINEWIKHFIVFDVPPETNIAAGDKKPADTPAPAVAVQTSTSAAATASDTQSIAPTESKDKGL